MKILSMLTTVVALAIAAVVLIWKFAPPGTVERLAGGSGPARTVLCSYPVQVRGDSMAPMFSDGTRVMLSKCINDRSGLAVGTIVLYDHPGNVKRLAVIRERIEGADGVRYLVSQEARQEDLDETRPDRILALYEQ